MTPLRGVPRESRRSQAAGMHQARSSSWSGSALDQGQALGANIGAGDVPAAEIAVEQLAAAKCAVRGVAEGVSLRVVDQEVELTVRVGAVDARRLVAGDVEPAVYVEGEAVR